MSKEVSIRTAEKADIPQLLKLYKELIPADPPIDLNSAIAMWERACKSNVTYFVADCGGSIAGTCYIAIIPNITKQCSYIGFIENVVVSSDYRRMGIGKMLMDAAVDFAKKQGCYKAVLQSGNQRVDAHKFYEDIGFDGSSKRAFEKRF